MFTITITQTETRTKRGTPPSAWKDLDGKGKMGWTTPPEAEMSEAISTKVFEQTVDKLDLVEVIKAVNGMA